jgi:hypothetical protein
VLGGRGRPSRVRIPAQRDVLKRAGSGRAGPGRAGPRSEWTCLQKAGDKQKAGGDGDGERVCVCWVVKGPTSSKDWIQHGPPSGSSVLRYISTSNSLSHSFVLHMRACKHSQAAATHAPRTRDGRVVRRCVRRATPAPCTPCSGHTVVHTWRRVHRHRARACLRAGACAMPRLLAIVREARPRRYYNSHFAATHANTREYMGGATACARAQARAPVCA